MRQHSELQQSLLTGLPAEEQSDLLVALQRAQTLQVEQVQSPRRRRRRDEDGVLRLREANPESF